MTDKRPEPDPLDTVDTVQRFAEHLRGMVAVLTADGWTDEQARTLVLQIIMRTPT